VLSLVLPFYWWLLGALIVGVAVGGTATWLMQARWRRRRFADVRRQGAGARPGQTLLVRPDP
jgi:hypothetical protein